MNNTHLLHTSLLFLTLHLHAQPSLTFTNTPDTIPPKEVFEMLEAMKLPEKLKEIFLKMKDEFSIQGLDDSGPFYSKINLSQHTWDSVENEFITGTMTEVAIMYSRYMNKKDIKLLTKFYKSSAGQKWVATLPEIQKDMLASIRVWMSKTEFELGQLKLDEDYNKLANAPTDCSQFAEGKFILLLPDNTQDTFSITGDIVVYNGDNEQYKIEWINPCSYRLTEMSDDHASEPMTIDVNIFELNKNGYRFMGRISEGVSFEGEVFKVE